MGISPRSSRASSARSGEIFPTASCLRSTCATSISIRCGACRVSPGAKTRRSALDAIGERSRISRTADASRTISGNPGSPSPPWQETGRPVPGCGWPACPEVHTGWGVRLPGLFQPEDIRKATCQPSPRGPSACDAGAQGHCEPGSFRACIKHTCMCSTCPPSRWPSIYKGANSPQMGRTHPHFPL